MATGPRYAVKYRRRRKGKTSYTNRLALLKSNKPRLVVRRSNKYLTAQVINYEVDGDKTVASATTKALKKIGWKFGTANIPAAYLLGRMIAKRSKVKDIVPDTGLYTLTKGNKTYAVIKGAIDGGLKMNADEKVFPSAERLSGAHISKDISKNFEEVKKKIN